MASGRLREGAYSGGSRMAADWSRSADGPPERDGDEDQDVDEPDEPEGDGDEDQDVDEGGGRPEVGPSLSAPAAVHDGAGWLLGLLVWGWVVMPFIKGGPPKVKAVLMAKFLNRSPDGSELP